MQPEGELQEKLVVFVSYYLKYTSFSKLQTWLSVELHYPKIKKALYKSNASIIA